MFLLISCEKTEKVVKKVPDKITYSMKHPQTDQTYKVVHAYKLYDRFIEKVKNTPREQQFELYKSEIIEPLYDDCFKGGEYLHMADSLLNKTPYNFTGLKDVSDMIDKDATNKVIKEALILSSDLLPAKKKTTVCIFPNTGNIRSSMITVGSGKIIVLYNQFYTNEMIKGGIAHEYHHSVWTEKHLRGQKSVTVLDNLIFEGKAVMFEKVAYPDITFTPVDPTSNKEYWDKVEPDLAKMDLDRSLQIIMGGNNLPFLYGYSEGYKMVNAYLEKYPDTKPSEWTGLSVKDIFEKGEYKKNYE